MTKYKRKIKYNKIKSVFVAVIFLITLISSAIYSNKQSFTTLATDNTFNNLDSVPPIDQFLKIDKQVVKDENVEGQYRITLKAEGRIIVEEKKKADIILIVDESSSMENKIGEIKSSMINFCNTIRKTNADVKISLVHFGKDAKANDFIGIKETKYGNFKIDNQINNISIDTRVATNTQAGIMKASEMMKYARNDSRKFIVLFTDGIPTLCFNYSFKDVYNYGDYMGYYSWDDFLLYRIMHFGTDPPWYSREIDYNSFRKDNNELVGSGSSSDALDIPFKGAQIEYNKLIGGIKKVGGIGEVSRNYYGMFTDPRKWWDYYDDTIDFPDSEDNKSASFYSIGIITGTDKLEKRRAETFLSKINNAGYHYSEDISQANVFYQNIANDINAKINSFIASNVVINDELGDYFDFSDNLNIEGIDSNKCSISDDKRSIKIDVGDMNENLSISFNIKVNQDEYFSGDNIETNKKASITYLNPQNNKTETEIYNVPEITIKPKIGTLHLEKEIRRLDKDNNFIENISNEDDFSVSINNEHDSYNFNVAASKKSSVKFYMKNGKTATYDGTLINHKYRNTNEDIGFINVSDEFNINELSRMKYNLYKIYYKYNESDNYKELTDKITIDKNYKDIYIKIVNDYAYSNAWTDDDDKDNNIKYPDRMS